MHRNGLPGCVVTDALLTQIESESPNRAAAQAAALERAARLYAVTRGMGFAGVHIGGHGLRYKDVEAVIARGEELAPNWLDLVPEFDYPQEDGWYFFERDPETGLNLETPAEKGPAGPKSWGYRFMRLMGHGCLDNRPLFKPMRARREGGRHPGRRAGRARGQGDLQRVPYQATAPARPRLSLRHQPVPQGERNGPLRRVARTGGARCTPAKSSASTCGLQDRLSCTGRGHAGVLPHPPANYDPCTRRRMNFFMGRPHGPSVCVAQPPEKAGKGGRQGVEPGRHM